MTDLETLVEPLKREVAVPGLYDVDFPNTDDADLEATLADAFGEAQLQGFFGDLQLYDVPQNDGSVGYETSKDLSAAGCALLVMFAGLRILRSKIRTMGQSSTYKAPGVEYSTTQMTTVLRDELAALRLRIDALVTQARRSSRAVYVGDTYGTRVYEDRMTAYSPGAYGAFFPYEWMG